MNKVQILVIEDDDLVRQGIVDILELKGWNAVAAKSCSEALVRIRGEEYMLYVLDMKLPDGNWRYGWGVPREL